MNDLNKGVTFRDTLYFLAIVLVFSFLFLTFVGVQP